MNEQEILGMLGKVGAVITNSHVVYTSGKHGSAYVNKDAVYPYTAITSRLCRNIAKRFLDEQVEAVIAPAIGGVILAQWTAYRLYKFRMREVLALYAEKADDAFVIKRGYDKLIAGKRALVVEDVLTTGGSVKKVVDAARQAGALVVGVGALCNRGGLTAQTLGVARLEALVSVKLDAWDAADCQLCARNVPINASVGKGREFLERQQRPQT